MAARVRRRLPAAAWRWWMRFATRAGDPFKASISVGIYKGVPVLDLDYPEDSKADTDLNVVMTESAELIEVQGTAEAGAFTRAELNSMLASGDWSRCVYPGKCANSITSLPR